MSTGKALEVGQKWKTPRGDNIVTITSISGNRIVFEMSDHSERGLSVADFRWAFWYFVE